MYQQLIDDRNRQFWEEVNKHFNTSFIMYGGKEYSSCLHEKNADIFVPVNNISVEGFTHELLHIWLRARNIFITDFMLKRLKEEPLLYWSFSDHLFEQLGHSLEHVKLLPEFVKAGFEKEKFLDDYHVPKCSNFHLQIIEAGMAKPTKRIPLPCLDLYVSRFFAMKGCGNDTLGHEFYLKSMQSIRPDLFSLLENFWEQWLSFDIMQYDVMNYTFKKFTAAFVHDLGHWAVTTIHTRNSKIIAA